MPSCLSRPCRLVLSRPYRVILAVHVVVAVHVAVAVRVVHPVVVVSLFTPLPEACFFLKVFLCFCFLCP